MTEVAPTAGVGPPERIGKASTLTRSPSSVFDFDDAPPPPSAAVHVPQFPSLVDFFAVSVRSLCCDEPGVARNALVRTGEQQRRREPCRPCTA